MAVVNATIKNRILTVPDDVELVCNNPTDAIEIEFDEEWSGKTGYVARFEWNGKYFDVPFTGNRVQVPELSNTAWVMFGVYADNITSAPTKVKCKKSILCYGNGVRQVPANPFYDEFVERLEDVEDAIKQGGGGGSGGGTAGEDGGFYIPHVDADGNLSWTASEDDMPYVEPVNIKGKDGEDGVSGVFIGDEEPVDPDVNVWVKTDGSVSPILTYTAQSLNEDQQNQARLNIDAASQKSVDQLRIDKASALIALDSGNPLEFLADADGTAEFVLDFGPAQNGVPAPDNICPLTKRTEAIVTLNGNSCSIPFGRAVNGGTVDSAGTLIERENIRTLDGSEGWNKASSAANTYYFDYYNNGGQAGSPSVLKLICSHYKTSTSTALASSDTTFYPLSYTGSILRHAFTDSRFATLAEWKEYVAQQKAAGTPIQVSEPVTNPMEYICPPAAFPVVSGKNIACGDVNALSVRYNKSLTRAFEELKNAILAMGGNV